MCVGKRGRDKSRVTISLCVTERAARRKGEHVGVVSLHRTSVSRLERRKERREKREEEDRGGCDRAREGQAYASPCVRDRKYEYPARLVWASLRASLFPLSLSLSLSGSRDRKTLLGLFACGRRSYTWPSVRTRRTVNDGGGGAGSRRVN